MSSYQPPRENLVIFDNSVFTDSNPSGNLTRQQADALYLHFPFGQGAETIPSVSVTGTSLLSGTVSANNNILLGGVDNVNYIQFPNGSKQYQAAINYLTSDNIWSGKNQFNGDVSLNQAVTINGTSLTIPSITSTSNAPNIVVYDIASNRIQYEPSGNIIDATISKILNSNNVWNADNSFNNIQIASTKNINFAGTIDIKEGNTSTIYTAPSTNNLVLAPSGPNVSLFGKTLAMGGGEIHNCPLVHSQNNQTISIQGLGASSLVNITGSHISISGDDLDITGLPSASKANQLYYDTTTSRVSYSPIPSSATNTFYVSPSGNNTTGTGSVTAPYLTIQNAINQCTGSTNYYTIYVSTGTYTENLSIGVSSSQRISIIGQTNATNTKAVAITGSLTIAASGATGNETNNIIAVNNCVISNSASANALSVTGQGFSLFINNCNIVSTPTTSCISLAPSSPLTRFYFDRTNISNTNVTSTNPLVSITAGQIWAIASCDLTNANSGGNVINVTGNTALLLNVSNSTLSNNQAGTIANIASTLGGGNCGFSNNTITANASASSYMFQLGNNGAIGVGGGYSFFNNTLVNTNATNTANIYIATLGVNMVANNNIFYSVKTSAMAFAPFNFISSSLYNIFRYTNNSYLNGNLAGTNTVTYPTVNGTNVLASESFTDVNYTSTFNNANMFLTNLPSSADTNLVTFNTSTKKIGYATIPSSSTLLSTNNAWTGTQNFQADVSFNQKVSLATNQKLCFRTNDTNSFITYDGTGFSLSSDGGVSLKYNNSSRIIVLDTSTYVYNQLSIGSISNTGANTGLQLFGSGATTAGIKNMVITQRDTNASVGYKNWQMGPNDNFYNFYTTDDTYGTANTYMSFERKSGGAGVGKMIITSDSVGIGNPSPSQKLDVTGNIYASGSLYSNNLILQGDGTNAYVRPTNAGSSLYIGGGNVNLVRLTSNSMVMGSAVLNLTDNSTYQVIGFQLNNTSIIRTAPNGSGFQFSMSGTAGWAAENTLGIYSNGLNLGGGNYGGFPFVINGDNGRVGLGAVNPSYQLTLSTDSAAKPSTNLWTISSDERLKTNIEIADVSRCYDIIKSIPLKRYTWKDDVYTTEQVKDRSKLGWIAQDVETVFPKAVDKKPFKYNQKYDSSNNLISEDVIEDCRDLNADQLYAALYGAVKCLINNNEELKQELTNLKNKYDLLEDNVSLLLSRM